MIGRSRRWTLRQTCLLAVLLPLAACDRESATGEARGAGSDAEGLVWTIGYGGLSGPDSLLGVDPSSGRLVRHFEFERLGGGLAVGEGALWATDPGSSAVLRLDLRSGRTDSVPLGEDVRPESIVIVDGAVWVGSGSDSKVRRIDPARREVVAEIAVGRDETVDHGLHLAAGGGSIWAVEFFGDYELHRIDPATNAVAERVRRVGDGAVRVAYGEDAVWVTTVHGGRVHRIDPTTLEIVANPQVGRRPLSVAIGAGAVWVASRGDESVARVDPGTNRVVATIPLPGEPTGMAAAGSSVWVGAGTSLVRIDPQTNQIAATIEGGARIGEIIAPR